MEKRVKVTFKRYGGNDWSVHVTAKNPMLAIVEACRHFVNEGLKLDEITDVKTEKSDSYL